MDSYHTRPTWHSAYFFAHWLSASTGLRHSVRKDQVLGNWIIRRAGP